MIGGGNELPCVPATENRMLISKYELLDRYPKFHIEICAVLAVICIER